ncbi:MAG TPA: hypothetical protein VE178_02145, partial [Silvibacterium sp.]|nr:hypothetical protein [Silvibacterium sp.]
IALSPLESCIVSRRSEKRSSLIPVVWRAFLKSLDWSFAAIGHLLLISTHSSTVQTGGIFYVFNPDKMGTDIESNTSRNRGKPHNRRHLAWRLDLNRGEYRSLQSDHYTNAAALKKENNLPKYAQQQVNEVNQRVNIAYGRVITTRI